MTQLIEAVGFVETRQRRWGHYLTLGVLAAMLGLGAIFRDQIVYATVQYVNSEAGIRANYPAAWLLDEQGDYVFRARDMAHLGYKTTIQVALLPFAEPMTARNLIDNQALRRAPTLSGYRLLRVDDTYLIGGDQPATLAEYTFVFTESNPFLEALPMVVIGRDIIIIRRGQAILISFIADADTYTRELLRFEQFLESLE